MPKEIEISKAQREVLEKVLANFAGKFSDLAVYGSRAQGRARKGSDIDLVIYGDASPEDVARLREALDESDLSIFADLTVYNDVNHEPLKAEIDKWAIPLVLTAGTNAKLTA
jgi:uncharacterized protein